MRKMTVTFSDGDWDQLCTVARREHRFPKQQIERWISLALSRERAELSTDLKLKQPSAQSAQGGNAS